MNDIQSLIFYIFSFIISGIFYFAYNKYNKKIFAIISFCIPLLISGYRYGVGTDYFTYVSMFKNNSKVDIGFSILAYIAKMFNSCQLLFFLYSFLTLLFVFLGLKNIKKEARSLAYFLYLFLIFPSSLNIIRQSLAVSIVFYAYKYICDNKFYKWFAFIMIAFLFHNTAIILLPLFWLLKTSNNKVRFISMALMIILSYNYLTLLKIVETTPFLSKYIVYSNEKVFSTGNYSFYLDLVILFIAAIYVKRISKIDNRVDICFYIFVISIVFELTGFFNPFVKRISGYFRSAELCILPYIPLTYFNRKNKVIFTFLTVLYCILNFVVSIYCFKHSGIIPYSFS